MPELHTQISEIDRRLREIQDELAPNGDATATAEHTEMPPVVEHLAELHASLLSSMATLLAEFQETVAELQEPLSTRISISAGPFTTIAAVHAFERDLARLPGVREVSLRGYEGDDRVVIDVQLAVSTP